MTVNCRIGNLETQSRQIPNLIPVNCRIGSLEISVLN